ncbi:MAG TPA: hypothetical protein VM533_02165 [Fimbriiglobus sp.]|jgi:hypothetical protein|nr:hypothetical protein [Fimbriiglobus sp.]
MDAEMDKKVIKARSRLLREWDAQWTAQQIKRGVDGPVPPGRPKGSDYNQLVPSMESSGAALDVFNARAAAIMKMGPKELGLLDEED